MFWDIQAFSWSQYATAITGEDAGGWRQGCAHAADLIAPRATWHPLAPFGPMSQRLLDATALLTYTLARSRTVEPGTISVADLLTWIDAHPTPPARRDTLAALLVSAGHDAPAPGVFHRLPSWIGDPVTATWQRLVDQYGGDSWGLLEWNVSLTEAIGFAAEALRREPAGSHPVYP